MIDAQALVAAHEKAVEDGALIEQPSGSTGVMTVSLPTVDKERPVAAYARAPAASGGQSADGRAPAIQRNSR